MLLKIPKGIKHAYEKNNISFTQESCKIIHNDIGNPQAISDLEWTRQKFIHKDVGNLL